MSISKQALDHLVLFVPANPSTNLPEVPAFFKNNFTLSPGGFHADGATSNALILLADGCYIELISFINLDIAPTHWWGPNASLVGWKDWCLTNSIGPEATHESLKETHGQPVHGGRKRADGVDVKWAVTFPRGDKGGQAVRGRIPFFCHDVTPRNVRVPIENKQTSHLCGALGVRGLTIIVKDRALLDETRGLYTAILGDGPMASGDEVCFHAGRVREVAGMDSRVKITLRLPRNKEESNQVGLSEFVYRHVMLGARVGPETHLGTSERLDSSDRGDSVGGLWIEYF